MIEINIQNLSAVPSVVYGILGLAFIVRGPLSLGPVLLAGGITLALLVLPVVIIVAREAIRAVPPSIREGSMALGATQWQTIWKQVLPGSIAGISTGVILALVARDRRDRAAAGDRRRRVLALQSRRASTARSPRCRSRSSPGRRTPTPRSSTRGRGRHRRPDGDPAAHELRGHLAAQPIRAEVVSDDMPEKTEQAPETTRARPRGGRERAAGGARQRRQRPVGDDLRRPATSTSSTAPTRPSPTSTSSSRTGRSRR